MSYWAKSLGLLVFSVFVVSAQAETSFITMELSCRMGECYQTKIRAVRPLQFSKQPAFVLKEFEMATDEYVCPRNNNQEEDCTRPTLRKRGEYEKGMALCSRTEPAIATRISGSAPVDAGKYLIHALDMRKNFASFKDFSMKNFLVVCHAWMIQSFDDPMYPKLLAAYGYEGADQQKVVGTLEEARKSLIGSPTSTAWQGRWYSDDPKACKSQDKEDLLIYTTKNIESHETRCSILKATPRGTRTELSLRCAGEGSSWNSREQVEARNDHLEVIRGGDKFQYTRCP